MSRAASSVGDIKMSRTAPGVVGDKVSRTASCGVGDKVSRAASIVGDKVSRTASGGGDKGSMTASGVGEVSMTASGDEEELHEVSTRVRVCPTPKCIPTQADREAHIAQGHAQHRTWCPCCMAGRSTATPHRKISDQENEIPEVSVDFAFMSTGVSEETEQLKMLIMVEKQTRTTAATAVPSKGFEEGSS